MRLRYPRSLQWRLVVYLAVTQAAMLALLGVLILTVIGLMWRSGALGNEYEGSTIDVLTEAVERAPQGELMLTATPDLTRLRSENPDLWFLVRDAQGHRLSESAVPSDLVPVANALDHIDQARLGAHPSDDTPPIAVVRWVETKAGRLQMLAAAKGRLSASKVIATAQPLFLNVVLPIIGLTTLATILVTPFAVRRAMAGLGKAAKDAEHIDIDRSGGRLSTDRVPAEVVAFVKTVNQALDRLDRGYERHKRFLADAAHELRTPIAILTTRISALPAGSDRARLLEDTSRLAVLAGQLLDLQRLDQGDASRNPVDLAVMAEKVVLDLAPLAFAAGYDMAFEPEADSVVTLGDETALERALANLVQNAIDHGGRRGTITVRVASAGWIDVCDEGDGIPPEEHEQVFEPFYRLSHAGSGAGLGLDLVQKIMRLHGGHVEIAAGPSRGACLRMVFPAPQSVEYSQDLTRPSSNCS
ncbi:HAMP domain-containing sensor histidine kinase [Methylosinus sp. LW3]|uniref:sensor histidine kinase n=1 Tax=Methylosinus sp. LW3 TaxID=107635 RepID=UPI000464AF49|nr:HAMP domain-containing sensor histidine kinase [Methylosinus sp. LW3]